MKRIGEVLVDQGVLNEEQVEEILAYSRRTGLRFGEAGLALNILTQRRLQDALGDNHRIGYFHLHPRFFPQVTKDLLSVETILSCGVLPLGYQTEWRKWRSDRKLLQLGLVNPENAGSLQKAEQEARALAGVRIFDGVVATSLLAPQFLAVLEAQYGVTREKLSKRDPASIDPALWPLLRRAG